MQFLVVCLPDW